jgi:hypothetical protein
MLSHLSRQGSFQFEAKTQRVIGNTFAWQFSHRGLLSLGNVPARSREVVISHLSHSIIHLFFSNIFYHGCLPFQSRNDFNHQIEQFDEPRLYSFVSLLSPLMTNRISIL